jgi:hypothetical protein
VDYRESEVSLGGGSSEDEQSVLSISMGACRLSAIG